MNFDLGETVDLLRDSVRSFAEKELMPKAEAIDRDNEFPAEMWKKMGDLGVLGLTADPDYGGAGFGYLEHVIALEEISRASASVGLSYGAHSNLCVNQINRNGTKDQKQRYLPKLISGDFVGAVPGVGSSVSNLISYAEAKRTDEDPDSFGRGNPKGVAAAESANSSSEGGSMVTLLALGIPGGGGTAIMLAAFNMHNITGGPRFIQLHTDVVYAIIFANFAQVILLGILGLFFIRILSSIVKVPIRILVPSILVLATFGSYSLTTSMVGPITVLAFGILGWWLSRYDYSIPGVVIGLLLGGLAESELIHTYQISGAQWSYLLERPATIFLFVLLLASVVLPPFMKWRKG